MFYNATLRLWYEYHCICELQYVRAQGELKVINFVLVEEILRSSGYMNRYLA